jgi:hypothetical protein
LLTDTESAERCYAIQDEIMRSIAVNGRGFTPLASLTPGIIGERDCPPNLFRLSAFQVMDHRFN